jgi:hypothetical protein
MNRMRDSELPFLDPAALAALAGDAGARPPCPACASLVCPGWESLPGGFDRRRLSAIGTLRPGGEEEPALQEHHPGGTDLWSPEAPIAPAFFPYNRCEVCACADCGRAFLRYTEYGGYYREDRIRALDPALVVDAESPP